MDFKDVMLNVGVVLKDTAKLAGEDFIRKQRQEAAAEQKYNDIIRTVVTLSDAGIKEAALYDLLFRHWRVDSRDEASDYIRIGHTIEWPYMKLREYLESQEYSRVEIVGYMRKYDIRKKLETDPKLCELPVEKLKAKLEKDI